MGNVGLASFTRVGSHGKDATISSVTSISVPSGATHVLVQSTTADVFFTWDGSDPSTSHGFNLQVDAQPALLDVPTNSSALKVISATGGIQYQFLKQ